MNTSPTFEYLEEYIEFIGGYRSVTGKTYTMFSQLPVPINLARYDVNVIQSLSEQTSNQFGTGIKAYTDKQADLAYKIVDKYRKQFSNLTPPVIVPEQVKELPLKHGIRQIDRSKTVSIENNYFILRFPFDKSLIDLVKAQAKEGHGSVKYNNETKVWQLALTEYMLNWIMAVCPGRGFEISEQIFSLYRKLQEVEQTSYNITLDLVGDQLVITNIPDSLQNYIETHLGGITLDNLVVLVDNSSVLGYTVSDAVKEVIRIQYPEYFSLIENRRINVSKSDISLNQLVEYAKLTNRLPVYVYENGLPKTSTDDIVYLNRGIRHDLNPKLLVSTTRLMIGSRRESWTITAEKMIFLE